MVKKCFKKRKKGTLGVMYLNRPGLYFTMGNFTYNTLMLLIKQKISLTWLYLSMSSPDINIDHENSRQPE